MSLEQRGREMKIILCEKERNIQKGGGEREGERKGIEDKKVI